MELFGGDPFLNLFFFCVLLLCFVVFCLANVVW